MKYLNLISGIIAILIIGFIYKKYQVNVSRDDKIKELFVIKKYLLNESDENTIQSLANIKKPIIWIHIEYNRNTRRWESFGSRSNNNINQDYLYLTLNSIINKCSNDFHIVLIDDLSIHKLLEDWNIDISTKHKEYIRYLGLSKILYNYGGFLIEPSFIMFKSLKPLYDNIEKDNKPIIGEFLNASTNSHIMNFTPCLKFIGCKQYCPTIEKLVNHLETIAVKDYTNGSYLEGQISNWLYTKCKEQEFNYLNGKYLGTRDITNKKIILEDLMSDKYLDLCDYVYCLYIPKNDLLKRHIYNWFVYLNTKDVLTSNTNIGKYLLISSN